MKNKSRSFHLSLIIFVALVCCVVVQAQSGRRNVPSSPPPPVPTPTPEPTPKPRQEEKEPDVIFIVGAEQNANNGYYPFTFYDAVVFGCSEVLRKDSSARVDRSERDMPRGEAIKKAKAADEKTYVVLLQLSNRTMSGQQGSSYDQVELEYTVFSPGTGKIATSGRTYQNANRQGPLVIGPPSGSTSNVYREQLLKRAGEEAGERILRGLHMKSSM